MPYVNKSKEGSIREIFDIKACCFYAYDLRHQAASVNVHFYEGTLMQCGVKG